jgi:hypothetical protein
MAISLPLLLIIIGIVLAVLVSWALGVIVILIGLALLLFPQLRGPRGTAPRDTRL